MVNKKPVKSVSSMNVLGHVHGTLLAPEAEQSEISVLKLLACNTPGIRRDDCARPWLVR